MSPLVWRGGHHQDEALLGRRELRNVVVRVGSPDMLLHGAIALLTQTSLPAIGAIVILQRTHHFIIDVGDREGAR
jgi:hypothetical protein